MIHPKSIIAGWMKPVFLTAVAAFVGLPINYALGQEDPPPAPPTGVKAYDTPNDDGSSITIEWELSADDNGGAWDVSGYIILRDSTGAGDLQPVGEVAAGTKVYEDDEVERGSTYYYIIQAKDLEGNTTNSQVIGPAIAIAQWFDWNKRFIGIAVIVFSSAVVFFIYRAKKGSQLFVRRIAGLEAVDEAIGRATEMGRPILYISGLHGLSSVSTIASMNILGRVARRAAEYDTPLLVPCYDPIVMTIEQEIVKGAYMDAGRPDAYNEENIFFLTDSQFGYAAAVDGIMMREKPATNFFMGYFYAESLILAETGHAAGAVQIAGTDAITQLPFFITACDYTLIGEELYAASAYLSREPLLLGSLKGQDLGKLLIIAAVALGVVLESFDVHWITHFFKI